jgi:peptide/nickel transport system substrate-binding protein
MAINREAINQGFYSGMGEYWDIWIHPDNAYVPEGADYVYPYDPEAAKKLLDESGFDYSREIQIVCNTASREKQCALVQQYLSAIGVKSTVQYLDSTTMWSGMYQGKYDLCMMGFMPTTDAYTLETVYDPSILTLNCLTDTRYAELYTEAKAAATDEEQATVLHTLMDYMYEQAPSCNIIWQKSMAGISARLSNADIFAANYYNNDTWNWVVATSD